MNLLTNPLPRRYSEFRWKNVTLLTIVAGAMFAVILLVAQTIASERSERTQVSLTNDILLELRDVSSAALNAETGQRGYLITLDRRYLRAYLTGRDQIEPALRRLRALIDPVATPRQAELVDRIETLSTRKFDELDRSVRLLEEGRLLDARRDVLSDEGQETMEQLRDTIAELERIELETLAQAARETARAEGRVLPLLVGLALLLMVALVSAVRLVGRTARAEAMAEQAGALAAARDRADLLARELNHRVKNLFAVVLAIVKLSARDKPEAKEVTEGIASRIRALLTAHEVSQGALEEPVASLGALVETTLSPYRSSRLTAELTGEEVLLPAEKITPLGLVLHELTTNAVKYGAWAHNGSIQVDWVRNHNEVVLTWRETGATIQGDPERTGFGSMLMTSAARQFGGSVERDFHKDGLEVVIRIPAPTHTPI